MKTPREWAKEFDNIDFMGFIADVQKDAYNQAINNILNHDDIELFHLNGHPLDDLYQQSLKLK